MNWWFASDDKKRLWINVDRWFDARAFARTHLGDRADPAKSEAPSKADYETGSVFVGKWSKGVSAPNSILSFELVPPSPPSKKRPKK